MLKVTSRHESMVANHISKASLSAINDVQNMVMVNSQVHSAQFGTLWTVIKEVLQIARHDAAHSKLCLQS